MNGHFGRVPATMGKLTTYPSVNKTILQVVISQRISKTPQTPHEPQKSKKPLTFHYICIGCLMTGSLQIPRLVPLYTGWLMTGSLQIPGACMYWLFNDGILTNPTFGAIIYWLVNDGILTNPTFGAIIYWLFIDGILTNPTFGAIIYWLVNDGILTNPRCLYVLVV